MGFIVKKTSKKNIINENIIINPEDKRLFIAFHKGAGDLLAKLMRSIQKGPYPHCEFIVMKDGLAYSSSAQDRGVRSKDIRLMNLHDDSKWDIFEVNIEDYNLDDFYKFFDKADGYKYAYADIFLFHVLGLPIKLNPNKNICSGFVTTALDGILRTSTGKVATRMARLNELNYSLKHAYQFTPCSMFIRYARFGLLNLIDNKVVFPEPTIKTNEDGTVF